MITPEALAAQQESPDCDKEYFITSDQFIESISSKLGLGIDTEIDEITDTLQREKKEME